MQYVWVFALLVGLCLFTGFLKSLSWFSFSLAASKNLHIGSLWGVLHSPLQFFVANPSGRILNRFSKDQNVVDEQFPITSYDFLQSFSYCLSAVCLVCIAIPYLLILMIPLLYSFIKLRTRYLKSSREAKRIESTTRSPIYADFSATLEGLATVRAYKLEERLKAIFRNQVNHNLRSWWNFQLLNRWIGLRLDAQTAIILVVTVFPAVLLRDSLDVGLVGFALVYVLNLSSLFQWTVRQSAEIENQMTSVERVQSYAALSPEPGYAVNSPPQSRKDISTPTRSCSLSSDLTSSKHSYWAATRDSYSSIPQRGDIMMTEIENEPTDKALSLFNISNISVTYRRDLPSVLRNISLTVPHGAKVGVCGRTGSGFVTVVMNCFNHY